MAEENEKEDKNKKNRARSQNINNQLRIEALTLL